MSFKPEKFGKYILLDKLAMGGMAEVYRAKAPGAEGIGKIIAIKRILPQFSSNADFIQMFKTEAKIAINLTTSTIGQIYEFGVEKDQFFLAMEFIDGRNLRQILSKCAKVQKALTIEQCVYVVSQVSHALDYAHRCNDKDTGQTLNIIHRDMSPQNIMVSFEGEVKIVDFGIAKAESKIESTRAGTLKGKFGYMSPEQAEGFELDARTDLFSTGIVLWELLSGERLFVANNEINIIRKIRECQIQPLRKINPNIHEELERISNKALAKDRSLRYQTGAELHRDLNRFLYKVNPEFTAQELGGMLKSLFKEEILEDRKKVAEFAQIKFPTESPQESQTGTVTEGTKTFTATSVSEIGRKLKDVEPEIDLPKNFIPEKKIDTNSINFNIKMDRVDVAKKALQVQAGQATNKPEHLINANSQSFSKSFPNINTSTNISRSGGSGKWVPTLLLIASIAFGAYVFLQHPEKFFDNDRSPDSKYVDEQKPSEPTNIIKEQKPEVAMARVFVHSMPASAQIEVSGEGMTKKVMGITPAEISIPLNKVVSITLTKPGHLPYVKEYLATNSPSDFGATLQKAHYGYVSIEVSPSANTDIYINGLKLVEKAPLKRYPVTAGTVSIKAYNPYSNATAEKTIVIRQDMEQTIRLFPIPTRKK